MVGESNAVSGSGSAWKGPKEGAEAWVKSLDVERIYGEKGSAALPGIKSSLERVKAQFSATLTPATRSRIEGLLTQIDTLGQTPRQPGGGKFEHLVEANRNFWSSEGVANATGWMNDNWDVGGGVQVNKWVVGGTAATLAIMGTFGLATGAFATAGTGTTLVTVSGTGGGVALQQAANNPGVQRTLQNIPTIFRTNVGLPSGMQTRLLDVASKSKNVMDLVNQWVQKSNIWRGLTSQGGKDAVAKELQAIKGALEIAIGKAETGIMLMDYAKKGAIPVAALGAFVIHMAGKLSAANQAIQNTNVTLDKSLALNKMLTPDCQVTSVGRPGSNQVRVDFKGPEGDGYLLINTAFNIQNVSMNPDGRSMTITVMTDIGDIIDMPPIKLISDS